MADDLAAARKFVEQITDILDGSAAARVLDKAGGAGKKSALEAASADLGADRRFRNLARKAPLNAGYDPAGPHSVQINFRPAGLWKLAESGRHTTGPIFPKGGTNRTRRGNAKQFGKLASFAAGQGHRAVKTPDGPRAHSSYKPSRGLGTFSDAVRKAQQTVPDAAADQIDAEIRRIL